ncbi:hypothetical protein H1C71_009339 [Ictidomys tridecemlineatus]|nr:hypothetical protein H1C71_009339 [Ictidomys tridecemlineatus]
MLCSSDGTTLLSAFRGTTFPFPVTNQPAIENRKPAPSFPPSSPPVKPITVLLHWCIPSTGHSPVLSARQSTHLTILMQRPDVKAGSLRGKPELDEPAAQVMDPQEVGN